MEQFSVKDLVLDSKLQQAFEIIKNASEHMTLWIQDADNKEKYFKIKPNSILNWYKINSMNP